MKPAWDQLMAEYKDHATTLIADVDCTAGGKSLCDESGVRGFPTIKYGDPSDLQDYKGGRSISDLQKFAKENLGPTCGPAALDLCDEEKKKTIEEFTKLGAEGREAKIKEQEEEMEKSESDFKAFVDGLQKQYTEASDKKDKDIEEIKNSGLGLMKAVHAHEKKAKKDEL